jgi:hypothetical protein
MEVAFLVKTSPGIHVGMRRGAETGIWHLCLLRLVLLGMIFAIGTSELHRFRTDI